MYIRAINGLPLGSTEMIYTSCLYGKFAWRKRWDRHPTDFQSISYGNIKLHLYNKKTSRKGRKMGHVTALGKQQKKLMI
jgi:5-(carboxyamino)imidazole ribonucleotide synthase